LGFALVALAAAVCLFVFDPTQVRFFPRCVFHQLTGLHCPGCGGQRALHHLLHGEFGAALHHNVLLVALLPLGFWALLRPMVRHGWQREMPELFKHHAWSWFLTGVVIGFGLLRNLPLPVFSWMSP